MKTSETTGKIGLALAKAQADFENPTAESENPHFHSKYVKLGPVTQEARKLTKHEISYLQDVTADGNLVRIMTRLQHSSGEFIESDILQVQARDAAPQAIGSCITYLRRYQLSAMLGLAPEEDDNGEAAEGRGLDSAPMPHKKVADMPAKPTKPPKEVPAPIVDPYTGEELPVVQHPPPGYVYMDECSLNARGWYEVYVNAPNGERIKYSTKEPEIGRMAEDAFAARLPVKIRPGKPSNKDPEKYPNEFYLNGVTPFEPGDIPF